MQRPVIMSDFGNFYPGERLGKRLAKIPTTRSGRFDRRYRDARFGERAVSMALAHCQYRWVNGENGPFRSLHDYRSLFARAKLLGLLTANPPLQTTGGNNALQEG